MINNDILVYFLKEALLGYTEGLSIGIKFKLCIPYIDNKKEQRFIFDGNLLAVSNKTKLNIEPVEHHTIPNEQHVLTSFSYDGFKFIRDSKYSNLITSISIEDNVYNIAHYRNMHKIMPTSNNGEGIELQLYDLMNGKLNIYHDDIMDEYTIRINNRSTSYLFYIEIFDYYNREPCGYISIKKLYRV